MNLSSPENINTLKTLLGETRCLSKLYYLVAAQTSRFSIHHFFPNTVS